MKLAFVLLTALCLEAQSPFEFRDAGATGLELRENGKPVFVYNYGPTLPGGVPESFRRSGYLHPVYAPNGVVVTDDFPKDHFHHRGIFWAWPIVRAEGREYDPWAVKGLPVKFVRWIEKRAAADGAVLAVENGWFAGDRKIVKETVRISVHPARSGSRVMDFALQFEAIARPVDIEGAPEQQKGYGGFSVRFAPRDETVVTTDRGREEKDTDMVPHPWAQLAAVYGGRPASLRIDIDPSSAGAPNGWCLRNYGFLGVNFPGRQPFQLAPGRPLSLNCRVTLTGGD